MLASGLIDIVIEDTLKTYDYMALIPVIEGAVGVKTDIHNQEIFDSTFSKSWTKKLKFDVSEIFFSKTFQI